ncbi:hypothetical protein B566_EDAN019027 [Ephemera danica]|nr:hypothetical protein B566_EDAN019027 [Ephemera danica]
MSIQRDVCLLFADVSRSTQLYETLGDKEALKAVERCVDAMRRATALNKGRVIKTIGDEVMAIFDTAAQGMQAASDMQQRIAELPPPAPGISLSIRAGMHFGTALIDDGDAFGDTALQNGQIATRYEIVRFGNVLGSTGSVIPKFRAQIEKGGPVTVTHPEITRYFMSVPEASQLVMQAAAMGEGGEIFVLDMGKPLRIADLAKTMIRTAGFREDEIRIVFTGLRAGEKLFEEPLSTEEESRPTHNPKVRVARARSIPDGWLDEFLSWIKDPTPKSDAEVRRDLRRWVADYQPAKPTPLRTVSTVVFKDGA